MVKIQTVRWYRGVGGRLLLPLHPQIVTDVVAFIFAFLGRGRNPHSRRQESDSFPGITSNPLRYAAQVIFTHWETSSSAQGGN